MALNTEKVDMNKLYHSKYAPQHNRLVDMIFHNILIGIIFKKHIFAVFGYRSIP